jgi:AhpD family alkylhydroperoxidase
MALTLKEKELVAVGSSVAAGCRPCTNYHVREVRKADASDPEIRRAIEIAVSVRREATEAMEAHGLRHLGARNDLHDSGGSGPATRIDKLVSIGAAFGVNCTSSLERYLKAGQLTGIAEEEIREVVTLGAFIKKMAASHVEKLVGVEEAPDAAAAQGNPPAEGCSCG